MRFTRREFAAALASAGAAAGQTRRGVPEPKPRTQPAVCIHSKRLEKLHYSELGGVIQGMGFDGCDLTVQAGGHVQPERAPADLVRAIEGIRDEGVDIPMISTSFNNPADPWTRNVLAISGGMGVPVFRAGVWPYGATAHPAARLAAVKRDVAGLAALGRAFNIAIALPNRSGDSVGYAVWDSNLLIADLDPRWSGFCFDPMHATIEGGMGGWVHALRLALPRLKAVVVQDFSWEKEAGAWRPKPCPLGEGMVDWPKVFAMLAQSRFTGPVSLQAEYPEGSSVGAIGRELEFVRKHMGAAYGNVT